MTGKVDMRGLATLKEVFHYAEMGAIEGIEPEAARYITGRFFIMESEEALEFERLQTDYDELRETIEEIADTCRRAL